MIIIIKGTKIRRCMLDRVIQGEYSVEVAWDNQIFALDYYK